ncbi:hypothetical protein RLIN73S_05982 [Rhodanobacter lindaniclasticus]
MRVATVDQFVIGLVVIREQAAIAACDAVHILLVVQGIERGHRPILREIDVHDAQRLSCDLGQRVSIIGQTRQYAGTAFGSLV